MQTVKQYLYERKSYERTTKKLAILLIAILVGGALLAKVLGIEVIL